jgi:hypothetical protein
MCLVSDLCNKCLYNKESCGASDIVYFGNIVSMKDSSHSWDVLQCDTYCKKAHRKLEDEILEGIGGGN